MSGLEKLEKLADFLDKLSPERFDYGTWVDIETWKGSPDLSCGTTACALGWATVVFPDELRLTLGGSVSLVGKYGQGYYAASKVFEISQNEARSLFYPREWSEWLSGYSPSYTASPQEVANHIRKFIEFKRNDLQKFE